MNTKHRSVLWCQARVRKQVGFSSLEYSIYGRVRDSMKLESHARFGIITQVFSHLDAAVIARQSSVPICHPQHGLLGLFP